MKKKQKVILGLVVTLAFIFVLLYIFNSSNWVLFDQYSIKKVRPDGTLLSESFRLHSRDCRENADCILMKNPFCGAIDSVNKSYKDRWLAYEEERAKKIEVACKPTTIAMTDIRNLIAICNPTSHQCETRSHKIITPL